MIAAIEDSPIMRKLLILGTVGVLQFDVVAHRLRSEYNVDCSFDAVNVNTARWIDCEDRQRFEHFKDRVSVHLALDHADDLVYIAPTRVNLQITMEKWPEVQFHATREHVLSRLANREYGVGLPLTEERDFFP